MGREFLARGVNDTGGKTAGATQAGLKPGFFPRLCGTAEAMP